MRLQRLNLSFTTKYRAIKQLKRRFNSSNLVEESEKGVNEKNKKSKIERREYFYYIDSRGLLFFEDEYQKSIATCLRD